MKLSLAIVALCLLPACGGGRRPPTQLTLDQLQGTWIGEFVVLDAPPVSNGTGARVELVIDGAGAITTVRIDGESRGTGKLTPVANAPGVFDLDFSLASDGGFYLDPTGKHAAAVIESGTVFILQKGSTGLPAYAREDVFGRWAGSSIFVDQSFGYDGQAASRVTVEPDGSFSGVEDGEAFASRQPIDFFRLNQDPSIAFWWARYSSLETPVGIGRFLLSPDKQFLAGFAGPDGGLFPSDFSFPVWQRQ